MFTSMMLTLLIVPVFYLGLERFRRRKAPARQPAPVEVEGIA
jgi:hypothetical protein